MNQTFAAYGLPAVACPCTQTLTRCSPTERGTKSALKMPSAVCDTCAGIDCPDGPAEDSMPNGCFKSEICFAFLYYVIYLRFLRVYEYIGGIVGRFLDSGQGLHTRRHARAARNIFWFVN